MGVIPKVETCIEAVKNGVKAAVIFNGKLQMPFFWRCSQNMVLNLIIVMLRKNFSDVFGYLTDNTIYSPETKIDQIDIRMEKILQKFKYFTSEALKIQIILQGI